MFFTPEQVKRSLGTLTEIHPFFGISYLAFKKARLPVGKTISLNFSQIAEELLTEHYQPFPGYGFYQPFKTAKVKRWISERYGSTSLQRITKDTFADALIHPTPSEWGWREKYVEVLHRHLRGSRIPAFDLAVWLYKNEDLPDQIKTMEVCELLFDRYYISAEEKDRLFEIPETPKEDPWLRREPLAQDEFFGIIGFPPNYSPPEGVTLALLELKNVGPAKSFRYEPSERLNILTGDNFLGKTFILESIWRVLTGRWLLHQAEPARFVRGDSSEISYRLAFGKYHPPKVASEFNWESRRWVSSSTTEDVSHSGIAMYARFDGSFAIWDPARQEIDDPSVSRRGEDFLFLSRDEVWDGLKTKGGVRRSKQLCNGLISDWIRWLTDPAYREQLVTLIACLTAMSPPDMPLTLGKPMRIPPDTRDFPTVGLPYGEVPVILVAAGVQRALTLAYMLVWSWHEHLANCHAKHRQPQRRMVVIVDEIEAHLHPRWQRGIVPALMQVISHLSNDVKPQLHVATHSPLVMASAEPIFEPEKDRLHHLKLDGDEVVLEELQFVRRGTVDSWLMSDVFGLAYPRSIPAEKAIEHAKALQMNTKADRREIERVHRDLVRYLAPDDEFWPRWRHFATEHGVDE